VTSTTGRESPARTPGERVIGSPDQWQLLMTRFICTHAFAQALYLAHASFLRAGVIRLSSHSAAFWSDIRNATISHPDTVWTRGDGQYEDALRKLWEVAEAYVRSARRYVQPSGEMSEQIDR